MSISLDSSRLDHKIWTQSGGLKETADRLFPQGILSLDLEGIEKINAIGALRTDNLTTFNCRKRKGSLSKELKQLDAFAKGVSVLLGHNIIEHDIPLLKKYDNALSLLSIDDNALSLLSIPVIDTLYLSPLAFPKNPYHHLVKQYKDPALACVQVNDPLLDSELTMRLFGDITARFQELNDQEPDRVKAYHALFSTAANLEGFDLFFQKIRSVEGKPQFKKNLPVIAKLLAQFGCPEQASNIVQMLEKDPAKMAISVAFLLAWLPESGGSSIIPPYVEHRFKPSHLANRLRMSPCDNRDCEWCSQRLNPENALKRYFGFERYKPEPKGPGGESLQRQITAKNLAGKNLLGILPTGTGKSLCYQLPALVRHHNSGALTIVFSPLVALMSDQVAGMEKAGITTATTINGLLSMPERADALSKVRLGDAAIVLVAPEQLRNRSFKEAIAGRHIGSWVIDEAHCLSKWGHEFRPDYRYIAKFIAERCADDLVPIQCLTATAKPDVAKDILDHFEEKLDLKLELIDGGAERVNLDFSIIPTDPRRRVEDIHKSLSRRLGPENPGGGIVYCRTRRSSEETTQELSDLGIKAKYFHSGLTPENKKSIQTDFHAGKIDVVVATNAFGMGIDKPDVRVVVHAEIPGSLESYFQEAGRAGRDNEPAYCVMLFDPEDVDRQFALTARSRLTQRDIQAVHRAIKSLEERRRRHLKNKNEPLVATAGDILLEDREREFTRDSAIPDDRVRTSIAWLEESVLVKRDENRTTVFPASLIINQFNTAKQHILSEGAKKGIRADVLERMIKIVGHMIEARPNQGINTDQLMSGCGCSLHQLRQALSTMEVLGVAKNDFQLTTFIHSGVANASLDRLDHASQLEKRMIDILREEHPDLEVNEWGRLALRPLAQRLRDEDYSNPIPSRLARILVGLSMDGRDEPEARRSLETRKIDMDILAIRLRRDWQNIEGIAARRRAGAASILKHLVNQLETGRKGVDLLVRTTYGALETAIREDKEVSQKSLQPLVDRALIWMHDQEILSLNSGMVIFRPAMTLKVKIDGRSFTTKDFEPLQEYYDEQKIQAHVVHEYAKLGMTDMGMARTLAKDYFTQKTDSFLGKWFGDRQKEIRRDTLPQWYQKIVNDLQHHDQQRIVSDKRMVTNMLVLAGPGSGKTKVLVHRIAYLIKVWREKPDHILALTYNRHAAVEIKQRLHALIGSEACRVRAMTCHALAMKILGLSFAETAESEPYQKDFDQILRDATTLLEEKDSNAAISREAIIGPLEWILVDEYQDISELEYGLISALVGKSRRNDELRLRLFAVGDDDQNIYSFKGASVKYIRRFKQDYHAKPTHLLENYRSTRHIIDAANQCILPAAERLKKDHSLRINEGRKIEPGGGDWERVDVLGRGKVQILDLKNDDRAAQAMVAINELRRLAKMEPKWEWERCAVIARNWDDLHPVLGACRIHKIPAQFARTEKMTFWRARQTQKLLRQLQADGKHIVELDIIKQTHENLPNDDWSMMLRQALDEFLLDVGGENVISVKFLQNWLAEWGRDAQRKQTGLLLSSAHRAKGREFDHVVILDGNWNRTNKGEDQDAPRRLFYVAMTRARQTLSIVRLKNHSTNNQQGFVREKYSLSSLMEPLKNCPSILIRPVSEPKINFKELSEEVIDCTLEDVVLSYPAFFTSQRSKVISRIKSLRPGDPLIMCNQAKSWHLMNENGTVIGRMAQAWKLPPGRKIVRAEVHGIFIWHAKDGDSPSKGPSEWEVVVPRLVVERIE